VPQLQFGSIAQAIQVRLLVLSFFAWLRRFIGKTPEGQSTNAVLWIANVLAALLFGLGHLPAIMLLLIPLTPLIVIRAVILTRLVGIACGWLYQSRGLESAMISHFSAI
jgi:CAAX prenyl protease-like protein